VAPAVHAYDVAPPPATKAAVCPGQIVGELTVVTGLGLTVIVNVLGMPGHKLPGIVGVTVIVEVIGLAEAFVAVNAGRLVVPFAANPIAVFELVHANVAPAGTLVKVLIGTTVPAQTVIFASGTTVGLGVTFTTNGNEIEVKQALIGVPVTV
jgi:hypothetical protein